MNSIIKKIRESNGLGTKTGKIVNNKEVHALGIGIYHGLTPHRKIPEEVLNGNEDVRREPHYAKGGFVFGTAVKWTAIASLGGAVM